MPVRGVAEGGLPEPLEAPTTVTESISQAWLAQQCRLISGATRGVLVLGLARSLSPVARWPAEAGCNADLTAAANAAVNRRSVVVQWRPPSVASPVSVSRIAVPISRGAHVLGAVAVEVADAKETESQVTVELLRLGTVWLELLGQSEAAKAPLVMALELVGVALAHRPFHAAATAVATELATRLGLERVSVGFLRRGQIRVEALSHSSEFDDKANLICDVGLAMDEAADQDATITHPSPANSQPRVTHAHEQLARQHGTTAVCTTPIVEAGSVVGAITFEQAQGASFDAETLEFCEGLTSVVGPVLAVQRAAGARSLERGREFVRTHVTKLIGAHPTTMRAAAAAAVGLLLFLALATGDFRITARATLEGRVQRAIVAGVDGYIAEANARAGDVVRKGQLLGRLDDRDLTLERAKWAGRRDQFWREYREALSMHDRIEVNILSAKLAQATAQLRLLDENLTRLQLVAPFDGIVVSGDLSQLLGSPAEKGELLFEVAPLDGYRTILEVDERDIAYVKAGQPVELGLSALPREALSLTVERVIPVATAEDGRNFFRVEASLKRPAKSLRPGMEGVAKIQVDRRRLLWIATRRLIDWFHLWNWSGRL